MDGANIFGDFLSAEILPDHILETAITPEEEFFNILETADEMDDLGFSLLENNHELIDMMAPMFATSFSPVPYDNIDFIDSDVQNVHQQIVDNKNPETGSSLSPLKQLLLSKTKLTGQGNHSMQSNKSSKAQNKQSSRRKSVRTSKSLRTSSTEHPKKQTKKAGVSYSDDFEFYSQSTNSSEFNGTQDDKSKIKAASKALKFPPAQSAEAKHPDYITGLTAVKRAKASSEDSFYETKNTNVLRTVTVKLSIRIERTVQVVA